ncbi:MAG: hypothetical protein FWG81_11780 [Betaproteobacteria bacterium]|nr:hypothetical protein [Betaproteobacteria bacterium]
MLKNSLFFGVAKWIAIALAFCALLGCVYSLVVTLRSFGPGSFNVPAFDAKTYAREQQRLGMSPHANDPQVQQERLEITKRYGDRILAVISSRALTTMKLEDIVAFMQENIPTERQADFIAGWEAYLNQGMAYLQENNRLTNTAGEELNQFFQSSFLASLRSSKDETRQFAHDRIIYMCAAVSLAILFIVAMIVPFLAAIEANTRLRGKPVALAAPFTPTGTPCPKCGAIIAPGDTICGECGTHQEGA